MGVKIDEPRSCVLKVRVTATEKLVIDKLRGQCTVSDYARDALLKNNKKILRPITRFQISALSMLDGIYFKLIKQGTLSAEVYLNTLAQLAKLQILIESMK